MLASIEGRGPAMRKAALNLIGAVLLAATSSACLGDQESASPELYMSSLYGAYDGSYCPGCPPVILAHCAGLARSAGGRGGPGRGGHAHGGHGGHH